MNRLLSSILGLVFLAAAGAKVVKPGPLSYSVGYLVDRWLDISLSATGIRVIILATIIIESSLGVLLLMGWRRRLLGMVAFFVLIGLTGAMALLATDPAAPTCGCFAEIKMTEDARALNALGLVRNTALLALSALVIAGARPHPVSES